MKKGSPPPEPVPTQGRTALGLEKNKAITAGERPQFMDIRRLGSSRFSPYEAKRLRLWKHRERWVDIGSDDEDLIHTSNYFTTHESGWVTILCVGLLSKPFQAESWKDERTQS